jgi:hypothetical protein
MPWEKKLLWKGHKERLNERITKAFNVLRSGREAHGERAVSVQESSVRNTGE